jgi:glycerophosphoryl diester phosphodiesterase
MNILLDPSARPIIAHRGASADAPENTLAAFELAVAQGADALELDVRVTGDGEAVVVHDATLERTTDRAGAVAELSLVEVREADAGFRFSPDGGRSHPWRGRGVRVPLLSEVLERFPHVPLLIEIKTPGAASAVRRVLAVHGAAERCGVAAFEHAALAPFVRPPFRRGASRRELMWFWSATAVGIPRRRLSFDLVAAPERWHGLPVPTRRLVRALRALGCPVHVWTVNDPAAAQRLWERGISGIVTDRPATLRAEAGAGSREQYPPL